MFPETDYVEERNELRLELLHKIRKLSPEQCQSLLTYMSGWAPEEMDAAWFHWQSLHEDIERRLAERQTPPQ